jgi:hypothetical protein
LAHRGSITLLDERARTTTSVLAWNAANGLSVTRAA